MAKKTIGVWEENFASNPKVRERVESLVIPMIRATRDERMLLEPEWVKFVNMWNVKKDEWHNYKGRAQLYLPEVRKNVEAQARQLTRLAFPKGDYFDCSPGLTGTNEGASIWKSLMRHYLDASNVRIKYHAFARQAVLLGTSPVYLPWCEKMSAAMRSSRNKKTNKVEATKQMVERYRGPDFVPRSLFRWFPFNIKNPDFRDDGCFEDYVTSYFDLLRKEKAGHLVNLSEILNSSGEAYSEDNLKRDVEIAERMDLMLENKGYAGEVDLSGDKDTPVERRNFLCTRIFLDAVLPEAFDENHDEDPELPIPLMIEIYGNKMAGMIRRNPHWHQTPPYVVGWYVPPGVDEFYGQGIPWATQYMQLEMNSTAEQAMDSKTLALNPIAIIDPALASVSSSFEIEPGAKWLASPAGVKLGSLPDLTSVGYAAIAQLRQQMQDYSDRQPALPPQLMGKTRTATQSNIVEEAIQGDLEFFQTQNELTVLQPMLAQWESLIDQNLEDDQLVMILGRRASDYKRILVSKNRMLGQYQYFWKTASYTMSKPIMARQMADLMKVSTMLPPQAQQSLKTDYAEWFKRLWDLYDLPDADHIFGGSPDAMRSQDPDVEHKMLELGMLIEVQPADNDMEHARDHLAKIKDMKDGPDKEKLKEHLLLHVNQAKQKEQMAQQMAMKAHMMMAAQAAQGGKPPGGGGPGPGNRTQMNPNAATGDMASGVRP